MKKKSPYWWKMLAACLLVYAIIAGFLMPVPDLPLLGQGIRNLYFHVGMWFGLTAMMLLSVIHSVRYLSTFSLRFDVSAARAADTGMLFGILGILTGMVWAQFTWGSFWTNDPKLNGAAVSLLAYFAYRVLRKALLPGHKRARIAAVYNIFAFAILVVFVFVLPRTSPSIHPGSSGTPVIAPSAMDAGMQLVFFPAMAGWVLLAFWIHSLWTRFDKVRNKLSQNP
jgi:heme exporter protein C